MTTPRHIDDDERRRRVVRRHHLDRTADDAHHAVTDLVAVHSSDPLTPFLALWARVPDISIADIEDALYDDGRLWRLHAMRRTLWVVTVDDAPVILSGATERVAARERTRLAGWVAQARNETPAAARAWLATLEDRVRDHLAEHGPLDTRGLTAAVPDLATRVTVGSGRWATETALSSRLLFLMAMDGDLVRGAPRGSWRASQYVWHRAEDHLDDDVRAAVRARPSPASAREALARRWLARFGPATTEDLKWWTGWTVTHTRAALRAVDAVEVTTDDGPAWVLAGDEEPEPPLEAPVVTLLGGLDPSTMGWTRRRFHLGAHSQALFDRNGNAGPTIWVDGRVVGGWGQGPDGDVRTRLLEDVGADMTAPIEERAAALEAWVDGPVTPRFRTPLERELSGS